MKNIIIGLSLFFTSPIYTIAQSKKDIAQAEIYYKEAIELSRMSNSRDKAIVLLKKAEHLDPDNIDYPYEVAHVFYKQSKYLKAVQYLSRYTFHENVNEQSFELLGDSYKRLKQYDDAIDALNDGIYQFPNSGKLFHEQGVIEYRRKDYNKAMSYWEQGIKADPNFSSNYYSLAKLLSYSNETVWAVLYGEMFMNLEPTTERSEEMSQILYKTYKKSIHLNVDPTNVQFTQDVILPSSILKDSEISFPFVYGLSMVKSIVKEASNYNNTLSLAALNSVRQQFIAEWYKNKMNKEYPNIIFDFQNSLEKNGHIESYNYWLLMHGNASEFKEWLEENKTEFDRFVKWYENHRLKTNEKKYFSRRNYD